MDRTLTRGQNQMFFMYLQTCNLKPSIQIYEKCKDQYASKSNFHIILHGNELIPRTV